MNEQLTGKAKFEREESKVKIGTICQNNQPTLDNNKHNNRKGKVYIGSLSYNYPDNEKNVDKGRGITIFASHVEHDPKVTPNGQSTNQIQYNKK